MHVFNFTIFRILSSLRSILLLLSAGITKANDRLCVKCAVLSVDIALISFLFSVIELHNEILDLYELFDSDLYLCGS